MGRHLRLAGLVALVGGSGLLHLIAPDGYRRIVPRSIGHAGEIVAISGIAELLCAALMTVPRTRRLGGFVTAALLIAVFPANVQMALDGGMNGAPLGLDTAAGAWLRLPLQVPLVWAALLIARDAARPRPVQARER